MENLTFDKLPEAVTMLTKEVSELKRLLIEKQLGRARTLRYPVAARPRCQPQLTDSC